MRNWPREYDRGGRIILEARLHRFKAMGMASARYEASVVITTKNRRAELPRAVQSAVDQSAAVEVIVMDDGSTDGTQEMLRTDFPRVKVFRAEHSRGLIVQRNLAAKQASAPVVFSIDDDAIFPSPHTVEQTLAEFNHPRIGAVAIPYVDVRKSDQVLQKAPDTERLYVSFTYRGTAHALLRDLFLWLTGYRGHLIHQMEEGDYTTRMINAGYVTRVGRADPIHHFESPQRDLTRAMTYHARNHVLYAWHNVPMPHFVPHLLGTTSNMLRLGVSSGYCGTVIRGLFTGYRALFNGQYQRQPVTRQAYRLCRELIKCQVAPLSEIEPRLPEMEAGGGSGRLCGCLGLAHGGATRGAAVWRQRLLLRGQCAGRGDGCVSPCASMVAWVRRGSEEEARFPRR